MKQTEDSPHLHITVEVLADPIESERIVENLAKIVYVVCVKSPKSRVRTKRKP
jgi:acetolactate synthase small subunit